MKLGMKRNKEERQELVGEEKQGGDGVKRRKRAKRSKKAGRFVGLVLFLVIFFVGFLLWISGEMKNPSESGIFPIGSNETGFIDGSGVIIIE